MTQFALVLDNLNMPEGWHDRLLNHMRNLGYISDGEGNEDLNSFDEELSNYIAALIETDLDANLPTNPNPRTFTARLPINLNAVEIQFKGTGEQGFAILVDNEEVEVFKDLRNIEDSLIGRITDADDQISITEAEFMAERIVEPLRAHVKPGPVTLTAYIHPDAYAAMLAFADKMDLPRSEFSSDEQMIAHYLVVRGLIDAGYLSAEENADATDN